MSQILSPDVIDITDCDSPHVPQQNNAIVVDCEPSSIETKLSREDLLLNKATERKSHVIATSTNIACASPNANALITITFCDLDTFDAYQAQFVHFLRNFAELSLTIDDTTMKVFEAREQEASESILEVQVEAATRRHKRKRKKKENCDDQLFVVDTEPSNTGEKFPLFRRKYKVDDGGDEEKTVEKRGKACFNCGEMHQLRECTLPKNYERINMMRAKVWQGKAARYHENPDSAIFRPGIISQRLREALGLHKDQVPAHVYKMRHFGYPPGWLDEAKVAQSDLALFDGDGRRDQISRLSKKTTLNANMIIDYPGFNCLPDQFYDEYKIHGVPPFSKALCKENMIEFVNKSLEEEALINESLHPKAASPSLNDLEVQKRQLLDELTTKEDATARNTEEFNNSMTSTTPNKSGSAVTKSLTGTPILKSLSPYSSLPNADNFSKNILPLPIVDDSPNSGKYRRMSAILEKVRNKLKYEIRSST